MRRRTGSENEKIKGGKVMKHKQLHHIKVKNIALTIFNNYCNGGTYRTILLQKYYKLKTGDKWRGKRLFLHEKEFLEILEMGWELSTKLRYIQKEENERLSKIYEEQDRLEKRYYEGAKIGEEQALSEAVKSLEKEGKTKC